MYSDLLVHVVLPASNNEYQVAYKKVPMADDTGAAYTPTSNSGVKLESFIFGVFPLSSRMAVLSVSRETEFAPVINPPGNIIDSPGSARQMMHNEGKAWLFAAATATLPATEANRFVQRCWTNLGTSRSHHWYRTAMKGYRRALNP